MPLPDEVLKQQADAVCASADHLDAIAKGNKDMLLRLGGIEGHVSFQNVGTIVPTFTGKCSEFRKWMQCIKKYVDLIGLTGDSAGAKSMWVAYHTAQGAVAECIQRQRDSNSGFTWNMLRKEHRLRYSDLVDRDQALDKLTKLKQRKTDTPAHFAEYLHEIATEAYDNITDISTNEVIQRQLVTIFVDGLQSSDIARWVMRSKPDTLARATELATDEFRLHEKFKQHHRLPQPHDTSTRVEEPMEVDVVASTSKKPEGAIPKSTNQKRGCNFCGRMNHWQKDCVFKKRWDEKQTKSSSLSYSEQPKRKS